VIAYFDANAVDHCLRLEAGVTAAMVGDVERAVAEGRLIIPASVVTTEELLSARLRDADYAARVGRFYLRLASLKRALKQPRDLLFDAIHAYAQRSAEPTKYTPLSRRTREAWERLATGEGSPDDAEAIVGEVGRDIDAFHTFMQDCWDERRDAVRQARREARRQGKERPELVEVFGPHARNLAEEFARRAGSLRACRQRGIAGLLARRRVLAAAGGGLALVWRQVTEGLRPDRGDSRDLQHLLMATASDGALVTDDRRFRILAESVPGLNLPVVSVPQLVEQLNREQQQPNDAEQPGLQA
jgi:hypothetical protein